MSLPPITLIDDSEDDIFFITRAIMKARCKNPVVAFHDPQVAVRHFEEADRSGRAASGVVFCDLRMTGLNGFDVIARLRRLPSCAQLPIFVLSTSSLDRDREQALGAGATGYLVKFPTSEQFAEIIAAAAG